MLENNKRLNKKFENELEFLLKHSSEIPKAYQKYLASYYPDARVRKLYLSKIGVEFGDNSYANLGFIKSA